MKNGLHKIELEPDAKPVSTGACRTIAEPYMPALKRELNDLEASGIIRKIEYSTPWLHPIVVVPKKGTTDIRLCVDFSKLNKFVKRPVNPQPTPWETVCNLSHGTTHFAVFDALKGYHQIELDEESQNLTAFMTPFGRYIYLRLPFGLSSAGDVFTLQYGTATDAATDGKRATEDTLLRGHTTEELLAATRKFFKACRAAQITLNLKKIQWDTPEVLFGGFLLNRDGYRIDPALTKALSEFPTPASATDVRSFFGLANQICNFSDEISLLLKPMQPLLQKGIKFQWLPEYQSAFELARQHLASNKVLAYYDPRRPTRLVVDASRLNGLGFILKQQQEDESWRPVQAGSRFLTSAETRYAMIELEMLAIAWACAKTRIFTEGLPRKLFEIWTDHAPLVPILEKQTLPDIANRRLQRLKMKVEHLTFKTVWVKGSNNGEADALSRHPCTNASPEDEIDEVFCVAEVHMVIMAMDEISQTNSTISNVTQVSSTSTCTNSTENDVFNVTVRELTGSDRHLVDERLKELRQFCRADEDYIQASFCTCKGWPASLSEDTTNEIRSYFNAREDLYHDSDGFLCHKGTFVVPKDLRNTYLKRLLAMHQAAGKMVQRARQSLWWPFMKRDITNFSKTCEPCEKFKPSNPTEPIRRHEPATYSFQYLHMDLGQHMGKFYLIMVDQFSSYPHIVECGKTATTQQVIDAVIDFITLFSVPEIIFSDGGPQFLENGKFPDFCTQWGIHHETSSPYMSRSNGIAEEAVKEMKKIIRANVSASGILDKASALSGLQMFRNTARSPTDLSPAQIIFGHAVRDSLPAHRENFAPTQRFEVERRLQEVRELRNSSTSKEQGRELPLLFPGQIVRVQDPSTKRWTKIGTVINFGKNDREYLVKVEGTTYRRNRRFLKPQNVSTSPPVRQPAQAPARPVSKLQPDIQIQTPTMWTPPTSQPAQHEATVVPHIPKSRTPLVSQSQAFNNRPLGPKNSMQTLPTSTSAPSTQYKSAPPPPFPNQIQRQGLSPRSSLPLNQSQLPPRNLGLEFPPLPASQGHTGLGYVPPGIVGPPSSVVAGPGCVPPANEGASSSRPKRTIKKPVRFQD